MARVTVADPAAARDAGWVAGFVLGRVTGCDADALVAAAGRVTGCVAGLLAGRVAGLLAGRVAGLLAGCVAGKVGVTMSTISDRGGSSSTSTDPRTAGRLASGGRAGRRRHPDQPHAAASAAATHTVSLPRTVIVS